jgi:hypothetical protein
LIPDAGCWFQVPFVGFQVSEKTSEKLRNSGIMVSLIPKFFILTPDTRNALVFCFPHSALVSHSFSEGRFRIPNSKGPAAENPKPETSDQ